MSAQESIPSISKKLDDDTKIVVTLFFVLHFIALPFLLMLVFNLPIDLFPGCPSGRFGNFFVYSISGYITSSIFLIYFMI